MQKIFSGFAARTAALSLVSFVCGASMLAAKTALPSMLVPRVTLCLMAALSLLSLVLARALSGEERRTLPEAAVSVLFAAAVFGGAAWCCGLADGAHAVRIALAGGVVYALCLAAFEGAQRRVRGTRRPLLALSAFALLAWLAAQIFAGKIVA